MQHNSMAAQRTQCRHADTATYLLGADRELDFAAAGDGVGHRAAFAALRAALLLLLLLLERRGVQPPRCLCL